MKFELEITNQQAFDKAYARFQRFVTATITAEVIDGRAVIRSTKEPVNHWHLITFAQFYGKELFTQTRRLRLLNHQLMHYPIPEGVHGKLVKLTTEWGQEIHYAPVHLWTASSIRLKTLQAHLTNEDQARLKDLLPDLDFEQSTVFVEPIKYAYQIFRDALVLTRQENKNYTLECVFKTEWYELSV